MTQYIVYNDCTHFCVYTDTIDQAKQLAAMRLGSNHQFKIEDADEFARANIYNKLHTGKYIVANPDKSMLHIFYSYWLTEIQTIEALARVMHVSEEHVRTWLYEIERRLNAQHV